MKHDAIKASGGVGIQRHIFLTSSLDGGEWSRSGSGPYTSVIRWIWSWVGPRANPDTVENGISLTCRELNCDSSIVQPET
jgi:hypothetical protein